MDQSTKTRIMNHMNKDHTLSTIDYLIHYGSVPSKAILQPSSSRDNEYGPRMIDLSYTTMTIRYYSPGGAGRPLAHDVTIALDPPFDNPAGARGTLVNMAQTAAGARGFAPHRLTKFSPPAGVIDWVTMGLMGYLIGAVMVPRWFIRPLDAVDAGWSTRLDTWAGVVLACLLTIHVLELVFIVRPILIKYRAEGLVSAKWGFSTLLVGIGGILRLKDVIRSMESH